MPEIPHWVITVDERKALMKRISKVSQEAEMYKRCRAFKFSSKVMSTSFVTSQTSLTYKEPGFDAIAPLARFFS